MSIQTPFLTRLYSAKLQSDADDELASEYDTEEDEELSDSDFEDSDNLGDDLDFGGIGDEEELPEVE